MCSVTDTDRCRFVAANGAGMDGGAVPVRPMRGVALVLGTGAIASAIAVRLHMRGWGAVLSHDTAAPVLRRAMAFYDALFADEVVLDGVRGMGASSTLAVDRILRRPGTVAVTELDLMDLMVLGPFDLLIDARLQGATTKPDLRWLAQLSFGIGDGWYGGVNCDMAMRLPPEKTTEAIKVRAPASGIWHSAIEPGMRVFRTMALGKAGDAAISAPCDGIALGCLRDGQVVRAGMALVELAPHLRFAPQGTTDAFGRDIGEDVAETACRLIAVAGNPAPLRGY